MNDLPRVSDIVKPWTETAWYTDADREKGNRVHRACAGIAKGLWIPRLALYQEYIDSFRNWFEEMVEEVVLVEGGGQPLVSHEFGFKGTPDFIGKLKGDIGLTIVDWKTTQSASVLMQKLWRLRISGGYRILAEANGYKPIGRAFALILDADGGPAHATAEGTLIDTAYFLNALNLNRFFSN